MEILMEPWAQACLLLLLLLMFGVLILRIVILANAAGRRDAAKQRQLQEDYWRRLGLPPPQLLADPQNRFCAHCGKRLGQDCSYCHHCGKPAQ